MKRCPTCNRTYSDDTLSFCLMDGAILSAPHIPQETQRLPAPHGSNAQSAPALNPARQEAVTMPSPRYPTMPSPPLLAFDIAGERRPEEGNGRRWWLLLTATVVVFLLIPTIGGGVWFLLRANKKEGGNERRWLTMLAR